MKKNSLFPIISAILLSIGIAVLAYFLLIHFAVDLNRTNSQPELARAENLIAFYAQPHDHDVFILGSSVVNEGIDGYSVEKTLKARGINRSVYILGMNSDTPLSRVGELDDLIASKPGMVIIGLSYSTLANNTENNNDRIVYYLERKPADARAQLQDEFRPFLDNDQLHVQVPVDRFFDNRKFLLPGIGRAARGMVLKSQSYRTGHFPANFKDPWVTAANRTEDEKIAMVRSATQNFTTEVFPISGDMNPDKRALRYTIDRLRANNIRVVIVSMPINPLLSAATSESSRGNLSGFLNATGIRWYDKEQEYPSSFFTDTQHMNAAGRAAFSPEIAGMIADNLGGA